MLKFQAVLSHQNYSLGTVAISPLKPRLDVPGQHPEMVSGWDVIGIVGAGSQVHTVLVGNCRAFLLMASPSSYLIAGYLRQQGRCMAQGQTTA